MAPISFPQFSASFKAFVNSETLGYGGDEVARVRGKTANVQNKLSPTARELRRKNILVAIQNDTFLEDLHNQIREFHRLEEFKPQVLTEDKNIRRRILACKQISKELQRIGERLREVVVMSGNLFDVRIEQQLLEAAGNVSDIAHALELSHDLGSSNRHPLLRENEARHIGIWEPLLPLHDHGYGLSTFRETAAYMWLRQTLYDKFSAFPVSNETRFRLVATALRAARLLHVTEGAIKRDIVRHPRQISDKK